MHFLEERILLDGEVLADDVLNVSSFLNHQIDVAIVNKVGKEIAALFKGQDITKILTIEASGIAIAYAVAQCLKVPVLFAKKSKTINLTNDVYRTEIVSYTQNTISTIFVEEPFLSASDKVLIVDDFLAHGEAIRGLIDIIAQAGAELVGCAVAIEKGYQDGGRDLREDGIRVESVATIKSMDGNGIVFEEREGE